MRSRTPLKALLFLPMQRPAWKTPYIALQNTNAETKPGNDEQMRQLHGTHNDTSHGRTPRWRGVYKSNAFYKLWAYQLVRYGATSVQQATDRPFST